MKRIHLFEFEDQSWFPSFIRDYMTDFLQFMANKTGLFNPILPVMEEMMKTSKTDSIIDICSGAGGAIIGLNNDLKKRIPNFNVTLTDFYPNIAAFESVKKQFDNIDYESQPIDARKLPSHLKGFRTQFLSFHHFKPNDALLILQNAVDSENPIAIFEAQERSFASILGMLLSPISVLLVTPFICPFKIGRIIFTYLIPIVPLLICWDGMVSSLRTYSIEEMNELILKVKNHEKYNWQVSKIKVGTGKILYLIGIPKN